ncbi:unnamed protein product [Closterium sp. Naga37s-1]|nr:unnamed protein product [Closterium sp. Naga37s-1]
MRGGDHMEGAQESAAQEVNGEQGAEADEEDTRLQIEGADEGDGGEDQATGIDVAETAQVDENAGASQAEESHGRNASRGDEQRAEGSLWQERVAQDESGRDAQTERQREKSGEDGAAEACVRRSGSRRAGADGRMSHALLSRTGVREGGTGRSSGRRSGAVGSNGSAAAWCTHRIGQGRERGGTAAGPTRQTNAARGGRKRKEKGIRLSTANSAAEGEAPRDEQRERGEDARPANAAVGSGRGVGRAEGKAPRREMDLAGGRELGVRRETGMGGQ